jgi:ribosomal-protein-alanine N-acetyltransferase
MEVLLRSYEPADFETLYEIDRACYPLGIAYSRRTLGEFLEAPGSETLVARAREAGNETIAGFLIAEWREEEAHIITIDVVAKQRRHGVGTVLLREIERRLAGRGVRTVYLETATTNEAGVAFWKRHGYRSCGMLRGYYLGRMDAYLMSKPLGPDNVSADSTEFPAL